MTPLEAIRYMADPNNWDEESGNLKRPGGGGQRGIILFSATVKAVAFCLSVLQEHDRKSRPS